VRILDVITVDDEARLTESVALDQEDMGAARAELRRPAGNLATRHTEAWEAAWAAHDWDAHVALFAPTFRTLDHRSGVQLEIPREQYLESIRGGFEEDGRTAEAVIVTTRGDHLALRRSTLRGRGWEVVTLNVVEVDDEARAVRHVAFNGDELERATAELERLAGRPEVRRPRWLEPNEATAAVERVLVAIQHEDWAALEAACDKGLEVDDRRLVRGSFGRQEYVENNRRQARGLRFEVDLEATAGSNLALVRWAWEVGPEAAPSGGEHLAVYEAGPDGTLVRITSFNLDDRGAAFDELIERYWEGEGAPLRHALAPAEALRQALAARDLDTVLTIYGNELQGRDERLAGLGATFSALEADAYTRLLLEDSTSVAWEPLAIPEVVDHGLVVRLRVRGTHGDAGDFEVLSVVAMVVDGQRVTHMANFEIDQVDQAHAFLHAHAP